MNNFCQVSTQTFKLPFIPRSGDSCCLHFSICFLLAFNACINRYVEIYRCGDIPDITLLALFFVVVTFTHMYFSNKFLMTVQCCIMWTDHHLFNQSANVRHLSF